MNYENIYACYRILYNSLYANECFDNITYNLQFSKGENGNIKFTGINGEKVKGEYGTDKIKKPILCQGTINFQHNNVALNLCNKYIEEYKVVEDDDTKDRYIVNILYEINEDGEKKLIAIREGYFKQINSHKLVSLLKNITSIEWDPFSFETRPKENELHPNVLAMIKK